MEGADTGEILLLQACRTGDVDTVRTLLAQGVSVNATEDGWRTPLVIASEFGHVDIVVLLLGGGGGDGGGGGGGRRKGVMRNDEANAMALACSGGHVQIVRTLIQHGVDVNSIFGDGDTVLLRACYYRHGHVIRALLELGADANARDRDGDTCLIRACIFGYGDVVRMLVDHGASVNATNERTGRTALMDACLYVDPGDRGEDHHLNTLEFLITKGANVDVQSTNEGLSAVMVAVQRINVKYLRTLLTADPNLDLVDINGHTVFSHALKNDDTACLRLLHDSGELLNADGTLKDVHRTVDIPMVSLGGLLTTIEMGVFEWTWYSHQDLRRVSLAVMEAGLPPGLIELDHNTRVSPFVVSLLRNDVEMTETFLDRLYFLPEDYTVLTTDQNIRDRIRTSSLEQITHRPMTLLTWSLLTVSNAITLNRPQGVERSSLVNELEILTFLKLKLNFQMM